MHGRLAQRRCCGAVIDLREASQRLARRDLTRPGHCAGRPDRGIGVACGLRPRAHVRVGDLDHGARCALNPRLGHSDKLPDQRLVGPRLPTQKSMGDVHPRAEDPSRTACTTRHPSEHRRRQPDPQVRPSARMRPDVRRKHCPSAATGGLRKTNVATSVASALNRGSTRLPGEPETTG